VATTDVGAIHGSRVAWTAFNQAVFAFAPVVFGGLRDATGAYPEAFLAGAVLQAVAGSIIVLGRRSA
jgi:hypothetical protein